MGYPLTHHHPKLLIMKGATYKKKSTCKSYKYEYLYTCSAQKKSDGQQEGEHQEVHYVKGEHY